MMMTTTQPYEKGSVITFNIGPPKTLHHDEDYIHQQEKLLLLP